MWLPLEGFGFHQSLMLLNTLTNLLSERTDLTAEQTTTAAHLLTDEDVAPDAKQAFVVALAEKGETAAEVAAFAGAFRELAVNPGVEFIADEAIDIVGTGGDGARTFNISTAVSFIVAASGVPVLKHGNRSITSKCGSADILEAVGVRLDAPREQLQASVRELNFCFFFAPAFHPAFKAIMPVRKALAAEGKRTIFNLLGPLINPGKPAYQLMGVFSQDWLTPLSGALGELGLKRGMVVHGRPLPEQALDELSCSGQNFTAGFGALSGMSTELSAADAGLPECDFSDLDGGDASENLATMHALMSGDPDAVAAGLRDSVLLNSGAALWAADRASDLRAGVALAKETLEGGRVAAWLKTVENFYQGS